MKLLLSLFIAAAIAVTLHAQKKPDHSGVKAAPGNAFQNAAIPYPAKDTPYRYWVHFNLRIDTTVYMRAIDTVLIGRSYIGRSLFYDEAVFWQEATFRALQTLDSRLKKDTLKIQGGRK